MTLEYDFEATAMVLLSSSRTLRVIPTDHLERHVKECKESLNNATQFGAFIDPTAYREAQQSGKLEDSRLQLEIVEHLLAARKAMDTYEKEFPPQIR